ncbi:MAG: Holliday junction branch migration DNA helicase RuvB [Candidatus Delongbacteria bacterium]|nr:Holliday junction branch migration DNA helicase RuvB [Candidatus Delongbacteria bacterium]
MNLERTITGKYTPEDQLENRLRPTDFNEFVGQQRIKDNLRVFISAAAGRQEALDHCLFYGPPGLGKTTLAHIIAGSMQAQITVTSGPVLDKPADLAGLLTNLQEGDILFIDEIHRLNHVVEEYLYPAMEDYRLDIMLDSGASARSVRLDLPRFTLIGATTRAGLLTSPLRDRFGIVSHLEYYNQEEILEILHRSARLLEVELERDGAHEIGMRSRGTPRVANRLLRRVRDFAEVEGDGRVTAALARHALDRLDIDARGLDPMDQKILHTIIHKYRGGPVGLNTLSVAVGEEAGTIEEVYEPFLIKEGFLERTLRGRVVTPLAWQHLGVERQTDNSGNRDLFTSNKE